MKKYCITAANHNGVEDHRASEFKVWEYKQDANTKKGSWSPLGKKKLDYVAALLAAGNEVVSGKENKEGDVVKTITPGAAIEIELRIAENDAKFKITDLPEF